MSLTIVGNIRDRYTHGGLGNRTTVTTITGDSSYPTGGYAVTPAQLGMVNELKHSSTDMRAPGASVVFAKYFLSTGTLKMFTASGEVANGTDVSAVQVEVIAWGT